MEKMIVVSLNIGLPRNENFSGKGIFTGICKRPVAGPVHLGHFGFENDGVGDLKHHGGKDKAVCAYNLEHYPYWEETLGMKLPFAAFGENLTVSHADEDDICIGDIFRLGTALFQVSQPRQPCRTLAARYGRDDLIKLVVDSGRTGFYLRVMEEGTVEQGTELILQEKDPRGVSIAFANQTYHHDRKNRKAIEKVLAVPALSASWQKSFQDLKEKCI